MAFGNFKKMVNGSGFIPEEISGFFAIWQKMNTINKIKKSHDYAWYNDYLKTSKWFKEIFSQACDAEYQAVIPIEVLSEKDPDMLNLYLSELFVSHNVKHKIDEEEGVYVIQLTKEYILSK